MIHRLAEPNFQGLNLWSADVWIGGVPGETLRRHMFPVYRQRLGKFSMTAIPITIIHRHSYRICTLPVLLQYHCIEKLG
jgi:hypothetical protein